MNAYILSNINVDSIKYYLPEDINVVGSCPYGNYLIELIDNNSNLYKLDIDLVIVLIDGDELKLTDDLQDIFNAIENFLIKKKCIFLFSTIALRPIYIDTFLNISNEFEFNSNSKIVRFCNNINIYVLDVHKIILKLGSNKCLDSKFWYVGRIKYTSKLFKEISKEINSVLTSINTIPKKVLVLDLDDTLWGGIVGEDGDSISISNEGSGKIYSDFQKNVKFLKETGVLLVVNSKNNFNDAIIGLSHKNSILTKDDFTIIKANWLSKVDNMSSIASQLNLGMDSFVFIDDNPVEREIMRLSLPEIVTPEVPKDLNLYNEWFISEVIAKYFSRTIILSEDIEKTDQYKANIERSKVESVDIIKFLKLLDIKMEVFIDNIDHVERLSQLTQKTNQFNLTTLRYNNSDILEFIKSNSYHVYSLSYIDKYRDEGIVGASIIKKRDKKATIDVLLLSCRVLNRNVEFYLLDKIIEHLSTTNIETIVGKYYPTKKNIITKNFYYEYGFRKNGNNYTKKIRQ